MDSRRPLSSPDPKVYDHGRFVSELVWLPSYVGLLFLMIGVTGSTGLVVLLALLACRVALEFLYRIMFGARRRELGIGAIAFAAQCVIWGGVWAWYVFR
jgi:vacuolar-type H+-ATPase subunit I/STV1